MSRDTPPESRTLPPALAVEAAGLVDYSPDSIVSRTLRKTDSGSITVFSFDAGQSLSEHTAPYDALLLVLDGEVQLTVGGKTVAARAGQLLLLPANVPHAVLARTRFKMLLTMLRAASER